MGLKQEYIGNIQPLCLAALAEKWNTVDSIVKSMDDILDGAASDSGIAASQAHFDFLDAHARIETSRRTRNKESLCTAAAQAADILDPAQP